MSAERLAHRRVHRARKYLGIEKIGVLFSRIGSVARMFRVAGHRHALPHFHRGAKIAGQLQRIRSKVFFGDRRVVAPIDTHGSHQGVLRVLTERIPQEGSLVGVPLVVDEPCPARKRPTRGAEAKLRGQPVADRFELARQVLRRVSRVFLGAIKETQLRLIVAKERALWAPARHHF